MARDRQDGTLIKTGMECIVSKKCNSSDAMSLYGHDSGRVNAHCYSCGNSIYRIDPDTLEAIHLENEQHNEEESEEEPVFDMEEVDSINEDFSSDSLQLRKIPRKVAELYGIKVAYNEEGSQESYMYPTTSEGKVVGYAVRDTYKEGDKQVIKKPHLLGKMKKFRAVGNVKPDRVELFGLNLFSPEKHKRIFITTGQEDAIAGFHMTSQTTKARQGYAFVSVVGGDDGGLKNLKANLEKISKFEEIYICADKDSSGKQFEEAACKVLPLGKTRIMSWGDLKSSDKSPAKDLSDIWNQESKEKRDYNAKQFYYEIWNAERYSPAGIKSLSEGWEDYLHRGEAPLIPFPESFGNLNELTCGGYGADGEIINLAAPSSVGKSSFTKEMVYTALKETDRSIGVISLEETLPEFLEGMLSVHMSTQLNEIPFDERDRVAEKEAMLSLLKINNPDGSDRIHFLDDPGACSDEDDLWEKVDFLIKGLDCSIIILDPVTLALSIGIDEDDYTSTLVKKVKRHKLAWINVHHVRKSGGGGTANSEGADLAEEDIKGSLDRESEYLTEQGWVKMCDYVEGTKIAVYCPETKVTYFEEPVEHTIHNCKEFFHLKTVKGIDAMVSAKHTMYYQKQRSEELHKINAEDLYEDHQRLSQGFRGRFETVSSHTFSSKGLPLTDSQIRLEVACQADASKRTSKSNTKVVHLVKERKIERLKVLLEESNTDYVLRKENQGVSFTVEFPLGTKTFEGDWWEVTKEQAEVILEECVLWDGHNGNFKAYFNNCKASCDYIQFLAMGLGLRATVTKQAPPQEGSKSKGTGKCYSVLFSSKEKNTTVSLTNDKKITIEKVPSVDGKKYCFITNTGAFVSRRNGRVMMTGNSGSHFQTGMINLILTRNKVHEHDVVRNTTKIKMPKCRRHGKNTGIAGYTFYNGETGRLEKGVCPSLILEMEDSNSEEDEFGLT